MTERRIRVVEVPLEQLHPNRNNPREALEDIDALAKSIRRLGVQQPLLVHQDATGRMTIVDGHRRYEAALAAGVDTVPCLASPAGTRSAQLGVMLATAMSKALTPLERARAFSALAQEGFGLQEIAGQTGFSVATVRAGLSLLSLPDEAQRMLDNDEITTGDAVDLAAQLKSQRAGADRTPAKQRQAWFRTEHPLAAQVKQTCTHRGDRRIVGSTGCGQCWEHAIRTDERTRAGAS